MRFYREQTLQLVFNWHFCPTVCKQMGPCLLKGNFWLVVSGCKQRHQRIRLFLLICLTLHLKNSRCSVNPMKAQRHLPYPATHLGWCTHRSIGCRGRSRPATRTLVSWLQSLSYLPWTLVASSPLSTLSQKALSKPLLIPSRPLLRNVQRLPSA